MLNLKKHKILKIIVPIVILVITLIAVGIIISISVSNKEKEQELLKKEEEAISATIANYYNSLQEFDIDGVAACWDSAIASIYNEKREDINSAVNTGVDLILNFVPGGAVGKAIGQLISSSIGDILKGAVNMTIDYDVNSISIDNDIAEAQVHVEINYKILIVDKKSNEDSKIDLKKINDKWYITKINGLETLEADAIEAEIVEE